MKLLNDVVSVWNRVAARLPKNCHLLSFQQQVFSISYIFTIPVHPGFLI
jgi:hypothetical protein